MTHSINRSIQEIMKAVRNLINNNRIYSLMVVFILLFNAALLLNKPLKNQTFKPVIKEEVAKKSEFKKFNEAEFKQKMLNHPKAYLFGWLSFLFMVVFFVGVVLNLKVIITRKNNTPKIELDYIPPKWFISDIVKVILIVTFFSYLISGIEIVVLSVLGCSEADDNIFMILNSLLLYVVTIISIIYIVTFKYKQSLAAIGFKLRNFLKNIYIGIKSYIMVVPIALIVLAIVIWLADIFKYIPPTTPVFELLFEEDRKQMINSSILLIVVLGPIMEEIFFRGFSYKVIRAKWGVVPAIILTSSIFAALHANIVGFLPIMVLGVLLAYLYEKTDSLIPSITVHILHNGIMVGMLMLFKEII